MIEALLFIHQPDWVAQKAGDMSAAYWLYQTQVNKYIIFFMCVVTAFLRAGNRPLKIYLHNWEKLLSAEMEIVYIELFLFGRIK